MDEQLQLIQQSASKIKGKEIHKQGAKISRDYNEFIAKGSEENFAALEHDLQTLRDSIRPL